MHYKYYKIAITIFFLSSVTVNFAQNKTVNGLFSEGTVNQGIYTMAIERAGEGIQSAYTDADLKIGTFALLQDIAATEQKLNLILENSKGSSLNVRNQQMYQRVFLKLQEELDGQNTKVDAENKKLEKNKAKIVGIRNDSILLQLIRDTLHITHFSAELLGLRDRYISTDSLINSNLTLLNARKTSIVRNKLVVAGALLETEKNLEKSSVNQFLIEQPYLWHSFHKVRQGMYRNIKNKFTNEKNVLSYYLNYNSGNLILLFLILGSISWSVIYNRRYLKVAGQFENLSLLDFNYLNKGWFLPILVVGLNIAVVSNLYAPALFVELLQVLLLAMLFLVVKDRWPAAAEQNLMLLMALLVAESFLDLFVQVDIIQRIAFITLNLFSLWLGFYKLRNIREQLYIKGFFRWAQILFLGLNAVAICLNVLGRVSLATTLTLTAIISLTQILSLSILLKLLLEIIMLQIYTVRVKRGIFKLFDHKSLTATLQKPFVIIIALMWFIVVTANLNIWDTLSNSALALLMQPIVIGSIRFTMSSIVLFFIIIWLAHLLQNYVSFFFGEVDEIDDTTNENSKKQHSKLLVTRLIVLISGYLFAVAASGLPLDKLSIILGALGVGVGLGLQNIVNNFVSGIILIFDRSIQVGDIIDVTSQSGKVKSIGLRTTKINAANGAEIIIPNGNILAQNITNWTYTNNLKLVDLSLTVTGELTPENVEAIITHSIIGLNGVNDGAQPEIYFSAVSDGSYKILVKFWCSIFHTDDIISKARQILLQSFKDNGIVFTS